MRKYIKKPIPIEAFRWDGKLSTLDKNVSSHDQLKYFRFQRIPGRPRTMSICTLEGQEPCHIGDEIIRGVQGEYYVCKHDIFTESYRAAK